MRAQKYVLFLEISSFTLENNRMLLGILILFYTSKAVAGRNYDLNHEVIITAMNFIFHCYCIMNISRYWWVYFYADMRVAKVRKREKVREYLHTSRIALRKNRKTRCLSMRYKISIMTELKLVAGR